MSNELIDSMFDEDGDLADWVYEKMRTEGVLEGIEAVACLLRPAFFARSELVHSR